MSIFNIFKKKKSVYDNKVVIISGSGDVDPFDISCMIEKHYLCNNDDPRVLKLGKGKLKWYKDEPWLCDFKFAVPAKKVYKNDYDDEYTLMENAAKKFVRNYKRV